MTSLTGSVVRTVPNLPSSPYDDSEVSSNIVFTATRGDAKFFDVWLELIGMVSNNAEIIDGAVLGGAYKACACAGGVPVVVSLLDLRI